METSTDEAGSRDLEIAAGLASSVAKDLLRTCGSNADKGAGVRVVGRDSVMSASDDSAHGVAEPCCLLFFRE